MTEYTIEDLRARIGEATNAEDWVAPAAFGMGIAHVVDTDEGVKVLDSYFPSINRDENNGFAALLCKELGITQRSGTFELTADVLGVMTGVLQPIYDTGESGHPNAELIQKLAALDSSVPTVLGARRIAIFTLISDLDAAPLDAHDAYLRLHLISSRRVQPHGCSLDGVFGLLSNVVWTDRGPADPATFEDARSSLRVSGETITVYGIDKFPRMVDYVVPSGIRIADADRVRLGAHLAEGTTVMHEGFVNFNAGTLGSAMVEGRISAGVVLGADSDLGGGASVMGTLSGGGKEVISVGTGCLVGANAGIGISLGDNCVVEAGLYITSGTLVALPDGTVCKARELSNTADLLFRRNSQTGAVEAIARSDTWTGLNAALHSND